MKNDLSLKLSPLQRQVLVGTLLGDAHLRANSKKTKYQYVVLQSGHHKEYVFHLYEIFKNYTSKPPKEYTFKDKRFPGKTYTLWYFYTTFQDCFRFYAHQFYKEISYKKIEQTEDMTSPSVMYSARSNKLKSGNTLSVRDKKQKTVTYKRCKKVPKLIHKWLTPRAIAYWYMDDGAQKWKKKSLGVRFCTDSFILSDIDRLSKVLRDKYSLKISIQKKGDFFRIYVTSHSFVVFKNLIYVFLIPSMMYKFPIEYDKESK